jgi:rhodanese-related sulfurtransferase
MASTLTDVGPDAAARLQEDGALLVDVREVAEFQRGQIPGSVNIPLSRMAGSDLPLVAGQAVVFLCAGGTRTTVNACQLAAKAGDAAAYNLAGGLSAWARAGLAVERS